MLDLKSVKIWKFLIVGALILVATVFLYSKQARAQTPQPDDWYMAGANPQRTSHLETTPTTNLDYIWHRPIEAYIPQNVNFIAVNNQLYLATANGLLVFNANNGQVVWRFDTDMPLGNSPTVHNGFVYVPGYDRKVHILDTNGNYITSYNGAKAGYSTNPLVLDRNGTTWVYLGDRNGLMHAFTFNGTSVTPRWTFQAGHSGIHFSAAYHNDQIYFASNDNYAYALDAGSGSQIWKSAKLPGWGFFSFWPVIHQPSNSVIFARGAIYRGPRGGSPGSVDFGGEYDLGLDSIDIFNGTSGTITLSQTRDYFNQKPWRRSFVFLDLATGTERTFAGGYAPFTFTNTKNGNVYPPVIGSDGAVYSNSIHDCNWDDSRGQCSDSKGQILAWNYNNPESARWLSTTNANTEPQALSAAGDYVYRNLCCGRIGSVANIFSGGDSPYWNYTLDRDPPEGLGNYYDMWVRAPRAISFHTGWYQGARDFYPQTLHTNNNSYEVNTVNGLYHTHGDQNPLVYHQGKVFTHRHNTIIALGTGTNYGKLPLVSKQSVQSNANLPTDQDLVNKLETEISRMVTKGHFRPAYDMSKVGNYNDLDNYFENPGDTIFTLSYAYPYLSNALKTQVRDYLVGSNGVYQRYFAGTPVADVGWSGLENRQGADLPPDVNTSEGPNGNGALRPDSAYGLYLLAKNVDPASAETYYQKAKSLVSNSYPSIDPNRNVYDYNKYMTGYHGLLLLQELAGYTDGSCGSECSKRTAIQNNLNQMQTERANNFDKDTPFMREDFYNIYLRPLDQARNFMYLSPEVGQWYRQNLLSQVNQAMEEYEYVGPYWFVHHFNGWPGEATFQVYYTTEAMFKAKAWVQGASRDELAKYLDAPAYEFADLFYIQNLVSVLEASDEPLPTSAPAPVPGDANGDRVVDGLDYVIWLNNYNSSTDNGTSDGDFNNDSTVDGLDYVIWLNNYGT